MAYSRSKLSKQQWQRIEVTASLEHWDEYGVEEAYLAVSRVDPLKAFPFTQLESNRR